MESIQALEKNGPSNRAVQLRIVLASVYRKDYRFAEAEAALPPDEGLEPERRRMFLEVRAEIYAETGRAAQAVADGREALTLVQQEPEQNLVGVASAQAKLAEFLLADGKVDEAAELARIACDELMPLRHVDASGALVTLALILNNESSEAYVEEAFRLVRESTLSEAGSMARSLAGLQRRSARLQHTARPELV
jgi:tetratricopeptide (TPR) repeat protein